MKLPCIDIDNWYIYPYTRPYSICTHSRRTVVARNIDSQAQKEMMVLEQQELLLNKERIFIFFGPTAKQ